MEATENPPAGAQGRRATQAGTAHLFIPEPPGWEERSPFIARHGPLDFHHYDPYSQSLAKIERGHPRDLADSQAMVATGLVDPHRLRFDLLLVVPDDADRQHRKSELAYRVLRSLGRPFDVTVWRRTAFQEQSRSVTSLPATILREGVPVYAA